MQGGTPGFLLPLLTFNALLRAWGSGASRAETPSQQDSAGPPPTTACISVSDVHTHVLALQAHFMGRLCELPQQKLRKGRDSGDADPGNGGGSGDADGNGGGSGDADPGNGGGTGNGGGSGGECRALLLLGKPVNDMVASQGAFGAASGALPPQSHTLVFEMGSPEQVCV